MNAGHPEPPEHYYWKAAISRLPTQEMRDAAWEFFVRHLAQNPQMGDTFSGIILVMQANGLYMLEVPGIVRREAIDPLSQEMNRFRDEVSVTVDRHKQIAGEVFQVCQHTAKIAEVAATAVKELDEAVRNGWREMNTEKLAARVHAELDETLLRPLAAQCRQIEEATPALTNAASALEASAQTLRAFHFRGLLAAMVVACLVLMGGAFGFGWWKLALHYDELVDAGLQRVLRVSADNDEAFTQLTKLNASIRVVPAEDSRKRVIPRKFALIMEHAEDVGVEETADGKRVAIYFDQAFY